MILFSHSVHSEYTKTGRLFAANSSIRAGSIASAARHSCGPEEIHAKGTGGALCSAFMQSDDFHAGLFDHTFEIPQIVARKFRYLRNCYRIVSMM